MTKINYNKKKPHNYLNFTNMNKKLLLSLTIIFSMLILLPVQAATSTLENCNEIMADPIIKDTPAGINVVIEFEEIRLNITFANVTGSGKTTVSPSTTCPFLPDGFNMAGNYYNISTTAEHTGNITICINYDDSNIIAEKFLKFFHCEIETDEFYAYEQSSINTGDTVWNLTGASYPEILCSNNERLNFIIDSQKLEINRTGDNFVYGTSIYSSNGETLIGWLGEPFSVIEKSSNWHISRLLINEDENDTYLIEEGESLNLGECFMLTLLEVDAYGGEAQFSITKHGEEICNLTVKENTFFEYNEDLNNSGCKDNQVLKFYVETVFAGMDYNLVKINSTQFRSPDFVIIETPDTSVLPGFTITSKHDDSMLEVRLNSTNDNIKLQKGGTVNILNDRFRFKLDEMGNTGGILHPMSITKTWKDITSSLETDDNIIIGIATNLSDFIIVEEIDTIPPVIYNVTINNSTPNVGDIVMVTVSVTDNDRVDRVSANRVALTYQGNDIWIGNITAELGSEWIGISAWDATGLHTYSHIDCSTVVVNTPTGTDVQVDIPEIGAFLIFENVTQIGWTYLCAISEDTPPVIGFHTISNHYNIITTAKYTGNITVCLTYNDTETVDENNITILQYGQIEDQTEVFAITQNNINIGDTVWNLTAADYPDVLCEGSKETLKFIINGSELEIIKGDFVYNTSIYYQNGEPFISWMDEIYYVIEHGGDWYLSKMLIDETQDESHSLIVGESMNLFDGFAITPVEVDVDGEVAWFMVTKDGEYLGSKVIHEGKQYIYREDLNGSGRNDNWVIKFNVNSVIVSPDNNLVNISGLKQMSTDLLKIETPNSDLFDGFDIDTVYDHTIKITFDKSDDKIQLIKGGVVNLIGNKYRFKLDEQGNVGGILNRQEEKKWNDVTFSVDNNTNTVCGIVTDLSGFVIAEPINDAWREMWMGENSPGGTGITATELQDAIHHWLDDISIRGHILTTADLQEIIALWLLE